MLRALEFQVLTTACRFIFNELLYYIRFRIQQNIPDVMLRWQDQFLLHHR